MPEEKEVKLELSPEVYTSLEKLAARVGKTVQELIEDGVSTQAWFLETHLDGAKIVVEKPDGTRFEVSPLQFV